MLLTIIQQKGTNFFGRFSNEVFIAQKAGRDSRYFIIDSKELDSLLGQTEIHCKNCDHYRGEDELEGQPGINLRGCEYTSQKLSYGARINENAEYTWMVPISPCTEIDKKLENLIREGKLEKFETYRNPQTRTLTSPSDLRIVMRDLTGIQLKI